MTAGPGNSPKHSSRSSLKALITKVPLGTAVTFGKVSAKTLTKAEGSKTAEGTQRRHTQAVLHPSRVQRQVFSHLLICLPMPMPAPALDTVSTTRKAQLSY